MLSKISCVAVVALSMCMAVQFSANPTSEVSGEEKNVTKSNKTLDQSEGDESGHEIDTDVDDKDKKFLEDAMQKVLDPTSVVTTNDDIVENFKLQLHKVDKENTSLEVFMEEMDTISLEVCKTSQEALWSYVTEINNDVKKNKMIRIAAEEDEIKKQYWGILKKKFNIDDKLLKDPQLKRKIRIIKERGTNVQMPQSKQREEIDTMQRIWSRVTVCAFNDTTCTKEESVRTMSDVISIFRTSNCSKELSYYWKAYRDATGKKVRPIFRDYVDRMNRVAESENFTDAGAMWRYAFEDDNLVQTVDRIWSEIKPFYNLLHSYVRSKLSIFYKHDLDNKDNAIPAHLLGNLWAQEWQSVYPKVVAYPSFSRPEIVTNETIRSKDLFDAVDDFHQSLGFESAKDSYQDVRETMATANCLPSSHDMCDGVNYKIKWCGEKVTDVPIGLSKAARLLGHIQYFKHYRNLPPLFRDGPNPAFHDAISDIVAIQLSSPNYLKSLEFMKADSSPEAVINNLLWIALDKFPLMGFAYVLDKWRWDVFEGKASENWNQHWWDMRFNETGINAPVARNESDLDPAAKYHVVSHVQYITYLISNVLEFQILQALCKASNHTEPLHECSIYGEKEAGKLLSAGMSLGASEDWRTVLKTMTGDSELSTKGILEYFAPLQTYLEEENAKMDKLKILDMDKNAPIVVGIIVVILTALIVILYCAKKYDLGRKLFAACGLSKNGSLDIATNEVPVKSSEVEGIIREDKV